MALQSSFCTYRKFKERKRLVKKSLHNSIYFNEIIDRISRISVNSERKWGRMNAAQMQMHCNLILKVPLQKIYLPETNFLVKVVGIFTKKEIQIFNNGIPHNMPSFKKVIVNFECDFEDSKKELLKTLDEYWEAYETHHLPKNHVLFGAMDEKDWGFLEYKHLNHHLKQFNG